MAAARRATLRTVIRQEQPSDHRAVHGLLIAAFGQPHEAELVRSLRRTPEYLPELSFVAEIEGALAGHIAFSRVTIEPGDEPGLALAPVAVIPARQGRGIGGALIRHGLQVAAARGERFVVVLGHPEYYPRFGFEPAEPFGVSAPWDVPPEAWMVHRLGRPAPPPPGVVRYSEAFHPD